MACCTQNTITDMPNAFIEGFCRRAVLPDVIWTVLHSSLCHGLASRTSLQCIKLQHALETWMVCGFVVQHTGRNSRAAVRKEVRYVFATLVLQLLDGLQALGRGAIANVSGEPKGDGSSTRAFKVTVMEPLFELPRLSSI